MVLINEEQRKAIEKTEGPVLIIAGPGTGKTRTLIERTRYILNQGLCRPDEITLTTFTNKAAQELISRLSENQEDWNGAGVNVGNLHQLCGQILEAFPEKIPYKPFYRIVGVEEIRRLVDRHWAILTGRGTFSKEFLQSQKGQAFLTLRKDFSRLFPRANQKRKNQEKRNQSAYLRLMEELREAFVSLDQSPESLSALRLLDRYHKMLAYYNILDYSEILFRAYQILQDEEALAICQKSCKYLMIDEYQDTNPIQEKIIRLLSQATGNICVVGDDDQSLYRFRGATVENLFSFKDRYPGTTVVHLKRNYRSAPKILQTAQEFIERPFGDAKDQEILNYRLKKNLIAERKENPGGAFVYREKDPERWAEGLTQLIEKLHQEGHPYSDIAVLSHSVREYNENISLLRRNLKIRGIPLREQTSGRLTSQQILKRLLASILLTLLEGSEEEGLKEDLKGGSAALSSFKQKFPDSLSLFESLPKRGEEEREALRLNWQAFFDQGKEIDFSTFLLSYLSCPPFKEAAENALKGGRAGIEKMEATASYLQAEEEMAISDQRGKIGKKNKGKWAFSLMEDWMSLKDSRLEISSREEDEKDGIRIMTIHQSKGLEFPIVILEEDSLRKTYYPPKEGIDLLPPSPLLSGPANRKWLETMDALRESYTAMTRAQDLLVLTRTEVRNPWGRLRPTAPYFQKLNQSLPALKIDEAVKMAPVKAQKKGKIKKIYAYTTDLALYKNCPRAYFFYRIVEIPPKKNLATAYGSLIHSGLQFLHQRLTESKEKADFSEGYEEFGKEAEEMLEASRLGLYKRGEKLSKESLEKAKKTLSAYYEREKGRILTDKLSAEKNYRLSMGDYLLQGNLDLLTGGGKFILDFKSSLNEKSPLMDQYFGQLMVYRILVKGQKTGEDKERKEGLYNLEALLDGKTDPLLLKHFSNEELGLFQKKMDQKVKEIEEGNFREKTKEKRNCLDCPLRFFCERGEF